MDQWTLSADIAFSESTNIAEDFPDKQNSFENDPFCSSDSVCRNTETETIVEKNDPADSNLLIVSVENNSESQNSINANEMMVVASLDTTNISLNPESSESSEHVVRLDQINSTPDKLIDHSDSIASCSSIAPENENTGESNLLESASSGDRSRKPVEKVKSDRQRAWERNRAMKSASEWNAKLNMHRKLERSSFIESQTTLTFYPRCQNKPVNASFGDYPAALIPGQFQNYYKPYTTPEFSINPINTVMESEFFRLQRQSPEPILVTDTDLVTKHDEKPAKEKSVKNDRRGSRCSNMGTERIVFDVKVELNECCAFCCQELQPADKFVQCSKCGSCGHPTCMDMADSMYSAIKSYPWMCMECKPCSICSKLDGEDKMLFCDRCDRGYHTFCVGLNELPSGRWICPKFCRRFCSDTPARNSEQSSRSSTPFEMPSTCFAAGPTDSGCCSECGDSLSTSAAYRINSKTCAKKKRPRPATLCDGCAIKKRKQ